MLVSKISYFHPYLEKIPMLTKIFQRGWNHQLVNIGVSTRVWHGLIQGFPTSGCRLDSRCSAACQKRYESLGTGSLEFQGSRVAGWLRCIVIVVIGFCCDVTVIIWYYGIIIIIIVIDMFVMLCYVAIDYTSEYFFNVCECYYYGRQGIEGVIKANSKQNYYRPMIFHFATCRSQG